VHTPSRSAARLSLAACLGLLLLLPAGASASSGVVSHALPSAEPGQGARAYWTAKRMRAAEPLPVRQVAPSGSPATPLSAPSAGHNAVAPAKVDLSRTIAGHPPVGQRIQSNPPYQSGEVPLANQTAFPTSTNGRIFGKFQGIGQYSCSATVVASKSQSVIMTAGHCVFDSQAGFASKVVFVPAYHDGDRPFGIWQATNEVIAKGYFKILNPNNDYAALRVKSASGDVGAVVGEEGLAYSQPRGQTFQVIGYPFNLGKTEKMWNCLTEFAGVDNHDHFPGKPDSGVGCDMTEGASGGGWTIFDAQGVPFLNSVTSYGYPQLKKVIFGPYLTKKTVKIINEANG
jgi:V8-like Glu-specific endopeptidase